jgi:hypothetical protein
MKSNQTTESQRFCLGREPSATLASTRLVFCPLRKFSPCRAWHLPSRGGRCSSPHPSDRRAARLLKRRQNTRRSRDADKNPVKMPVAPATLAQTPSKCLPPPRQPFLRRENRRHRRGFHFNGVEMPVAPAARVFTPSKPSSRPRQPFLRRQNSRRGRVLRFNLRKTNDLRRRPTQNPFPPCHATIPVSATTIQPFATISLTP